ncbi:MAG: phosphoglucosamine mutase, partial [Planctomycetota bacterium]
ALLGHDGRRSGPNIVNALAHGLRMSGFDAVSTGLITTPGLAHLTRMGDWAFGAMVSASHNPADDNGVKLFSGEGGKLSDETEIAIEALLHADDAPSAECERTPVDHELELGYLQYLLDGAAQGLALGGMSIVLDCANGGGSRIAPRVFGRLGARVNVIGAEPDGANINADCGSTHPQALRETVRSTGAALGIALDGDGDRCILVDETSELVHGDGIMTALARHAAGRSEYKDPRIVATVMSNRGLHRALREVGVDIVEVGVGDRRVVEGLRREGLTLGGEQSGHIVFGAENHFIGDGIYTALRILRILVESGRPLSELVAPYQPYPQILLNVPVASKPNLEGLKRFCEARDRVTEELG